MTQVYTAPFLLVRPVARPKARSEEAIRFEQRLRRCRGVFAFVMSSLVVLLAYEVEAARNLGIPVVELRGIR